MACDLILHDSKFNEDGYWSNPIIDSIRIEDIDLFDQNGYDLTNLEKKYAEANLIDYHKHRSHRYAIKQTWFSQPYKIQNSVLNHSLLFERKSYSGDALQQLKSIARHLPLLYKVIEMRPKWGLDFSMDYADKDGNAFEVLHWEYDSFNYNEIIDVKFTMETKLLSIDWDEAGKDILRRKENWHHLNFFEQSEWKCNYFNIMNERFKMVIWK